MMDWVDVAEYMKRIYSHEKARRDAKIEEYMMLLSIIHAEEPNKRMEQLYKLLEPNEAAHDEVGDIASFRRVVSRARRGLRNG